MLTQTIILIVTLSLGASIGLVVASMLFAGKGN